MLVAEVDASQDKFKTRKFSKARDVVRSLMKLYDIAKYSKVKKPESFNQGILYRIYLLMFNFRHKQI